MYCAVLRDHLFELGEAAETVAIDAIFLQIAKEPLDHVEP